jgi:hypothetical protein
MSLAKFAVQQKIARPPKDLSKALMHDGLLKGLKHVVYKDSR